MTEETIIELINKKRFAQPVTLYFNHCEDTTTFLNCKIAVIDDTTIQIVFNEPNLLDKIRYLYALARFIQMIDVVSVNFSLPSAFTERMKGLGYYLISRTEMIHQYVGPFGKNGILIQKGHVMASADFLISDESLKLVEQYNAISRQMPLELRSLINGLPFCIFGDKALHFFQNDSCPSDRLVNVLSSFFKSQQRKILEFRTNAQWKMMFLTKKGANLFNVLKRAYFLQDITVVMEADGYLVTFVGSNDSVTKASKVLEASIASLEGMEYSCSIQQDVFDQLRSIDKVAELLVVPSVINAQTVTKFVLIGKTGSNFDAYAKTNLKKKDCYYTVLNVSSTRCISAFEVEGLDQITLAFNNARIIYPRIDPFTCFTYYNPTTKLKLKTSVVVSSLPIDDNKVLIGTASHSGIEDIDATEFIKRHVINPFTPLTIDVNTWFRICQTLYQVPAAYYSVDVNNFISLLKTINSAVVSPTLNVNIHAIITVKSMLSKTLSEVLSRHPEYIMHSQMKNWKFIPTTIAQYPYAEYSIKNVNISTMSHPPALLYRQLQTVKCGALLDKNFKGITTGSFIPETHCIFRFSFRELFDGFPSPLKIHAQNMLRLYTNVDVVGGNEIVSKEVEYEMYCFCEKMLAIYNRLVMNLGDKSIHKMYWNVYDSKMVDSVEQIGFSMLLHVTSLEVKYPDRIANVSGYLFTKNKREDAEKWVEADVMYSNEDCYNNPYEFVSAKTPLHIIRYKVHSKNNSFVSVYLE
ncbi:Cilia- and flagella-associated protein 61 N-terminal domain-containing protein [Entamoeba marina]